MGDVLLRYVRARVGSMQDRDIKKTLDIGTCADEARR